MNENQIPQIKGESIEISKLRDEARHYREKWAELQINHDILKQQVDTRMLESVLIMAILDGEEGWQEKVKFEQHCPTMQSAIVLRHGYDNLRSEYDNLTEQYKTLLVELQEAQQWIDSEPDWKDKYMANYKILSDERDQLQARVKELEKERTDAAGEFGVPIEELKPGSNGGKLLIAGRLLRQQRDTLTARLAQCEKFMEHQAFCEFVILPGKFCNCGYSELLQALTPPTKKL